MAQTTCAGFLTCATACNGSQVGPDPYGSDDKACGVADSAGHACPSDVLACQVDIDPKTGQKHSACTPNCSVSDGCPAPLSGTAHPVCDATSTPGTCALDCSQGEVCPNGMICVASAGSCLWPVQ